jgi:hypothetical protein
VRITITDRLVNRTANDGQAIQFAVRVYTDTAEPWVLVTPTTLRYRIDDIETGEVIADWTTVTPASTSTVTTTGAQNTISGCGKARFQFTVEADHGLSTNCVSTREYIVRNLAGVYA